MKVGLTLERRELGPLAHGYLPACDSMVMLPLAELRPKSPTER